MVKLRKLLTRNDITDDEDKSDNLSSSTEKVDKVVSLENAIGSLKKVSFTSEEVLETLNKFVFDERIKIKAGDLKPGIYPTTQMVLIHDFREVSVPLDASLKLLAGAIDYEVAYLEANVTKDDLDISSTQDIIAGIALSVQKSRHVIFDRSKNGVQLGLAIGYALQLIGWIDSDKRFSRSLLRNNFSFFGFTTSNEPHNEKYLIKDVLNDLFKANKVLVKSYYGIISTILRSNQMYHVNSNEFGLYIKNNIKPISVIFKQCLRTSTAGKRGRKKVTYRRARNPLNSNVLNKMESEVFKKWMSPIYTTSLNSIRAKWGKDYESDHLQFKKRVEKIYKMRWAIIDVIGQFTTRRLKSIRKMEKKSTLKKKDITEGMLIKFFKEFSKTYDASYVFEKLKNELGDSDYHMFLRLANSGPPNISQSEIQKALRQDLLILGFRILNLSKIKEKKQEELPLVYKAKSLLKISDQVYSRAMKLIERNKNRLYTISRVIVRLQKAAAAYWKKQCSNLTLIGKNYCKDAVVLLKILKENPDLNIGDFSILEDSVSSSDGDEKSILHNKTSVAEIVSLLQEFSKKKSLAIRDIPNAKLLSIMRNFK
jgi:hypothetical protein